MPCRGLSFPEASSNFSTLDFCCRRYFILFIFLTICHWGHLSDVLVDPCCFLLDSVVTITRPWTCQTALDSDICKPLQSGTLVYVALNADLCTGLEVSFYSAFRRHHWILLLILCSSCHSSNREALNQRLSCSQSRAVQTLFRSRSVKQPLIPFCSPLICLATYLC